MRPIFTKSAIAAFLCSPFVLQTSHAADWNGSYSAQGQCYCVGELPAALSAKVVPTPIGGQTISQVCKRVGEGPELLKNSGLFNFPVYDDAQCGNGPMAAASDHFDASCAGSLDGNGDSCQGPGPKWDLVLAFSKTAALAAANPVIENDVSTQGLIDKPVVFTAKVESKTEHDESSGDKKLLNATIIRSASTAGRSFDPAKVSVKSANAKAIDAFTGKTITIDGQRYLQANTGVSASGGEPGSKIILDDVVYLRDDAQLRAVDLYQDKKAKASSVATVEKASPKVAQVKAKKQTAIRKVEEKPVTNLAVELQSASTTTEPILSASKPTPEQRETSAKAGGMLSDSKLLPDSQSVAKTDALLEKQADDAAKLKAKQIAEATLKAQTERARKEREAQLHAAEDARKKTVNETSAQVKPAGSVNSQSVADSKDGDNSSTLLTALRMPADTRQSARDFNYFEALPVSYDVGGNGLLLEGSGSSHRRFQYIGSLGLAAEYQEVMFGGGYFLTPANADRLTVILVAGLEYGSFELSDEQLSVDFDDSGVYLGASTRLVLNNRFELKGGVGYSTFFEGDAKIFGGGYYHINRQLDVVSRFELGDNDLLGIGVRFYY